MVSLFSLELIHIKYEVFSDHPDLKIYIYSLQKYAASSDSMQGYFEVNHLIKESALTFVSGIKHTCNHE
jgi:hypothetical protein